TGPLHCARPLHGRGAPSSDHRAPRPRSSGSAKHRCGPARRRCVGAHRQSGVAAPIRAFGVLPARPRRGGRPAALRGLAPPGSGDLLGGEGAPPADDLKHDNAQWQGRDGPLRRAASTRAAMTTANSSAPNEPVTAALLVIGDEILSGRTKDKNIGYIAEYL